MKAIVAGRVNERRVRFSLRTLRRALALYASRHPTKDVEWLGAGASQNEPDPIKHDDQFRGQQPDDQPFHHHSGSERERSLSAPCASISRVLASS